MRLVNRKLGGGGDTDKGMTSQTPLEPRKGVKVNKIRVSRRLSKVDLDKLSHKLLNVLTRETNNLLDASSQGKLDRDDAASLRDYLKLMKDLRAMDEDKMKNLSDEELEKLAKST